METLNNRSTPGEETEALPDYIIRPLEREDREWVAHFLDEHWRTTQVVSRGQAYYGHLLPGFVAERDQRADRETVDGLGDKPERIGLLTYHLAGGACEILTLNSLEEGRGIGTALVEALRTLLTQQEKQKDRDKHNSEDILHRIWLVITNDNLNALRFWQKRGFELVAVHRNAIQAARRLKPQIPIIGQHGIPIRDEIELEYRLRD